MVSCKKDDGLMEDKAFSSVQFSSVTRSCLTLCNPMDCTPDVPVHHQLSEMLKLMFTELVMPSNHLILCHPLLLPSIFPSIRVFFRSLHQVGKVLEFQLQHQLTFFQQLCNTWFEIRNCNASSIFLLSQNCFDYLRSLVVPYEF